jgi:hypothetical protein
MMMATAPMIVHNLGVDLKIEHLDHKIQPHLTMMIWKMTGRMVRNPGPQTTTGGVTNSSPKDNNVRAPEASKEIREIKVEEGSKSPNQPSINPVSTNVMANPKNVETITHLSQIAISLIIAIIIPQPLKSLYAMTNSP